MDVKKDRNALCRFDCAGIHLLMATTIQCYCFLFLSFFLLLLKFKTTTTTKEKR